MRVRSGRAAAQRQRRRPGGRRSGRARARRRGGRAAGAGDPACARSWRSWFARRSARPRASEDEDAAVVRAWSEAGLLRIEVADAGLPLTPAESRHAPSRRLAALGFVDELHIRARGKDGNLAECALRLEPLESDLGGEQVLDEDAPVALRRGGRGARGAARWRPGDALGLVRCVYRCYGYSYKDSLLYEPRHIAEALRDGRMRSVVAVTADGTVVGHCAVFVERKGDPVPESGRLVVDPRYRGHHLAERMAAARRELAGEQGAVGIWAEAVTNHPSSQREVIKLGGVEVGLLIGGSPAAVRMAGFANPNEGRRSLIVTYTPLDAGGARRSIVPERHAAIVAELAGAGSDSSARSQRTDGRYGRQRPRSDLDEGHPGDRAWRTSASVTPVATSPLAGRRRARGARRLRSRSRAPRRSPRRCPGDRIGRGALEALDFAFAAWIPDFAPDGDILRLQRVGSHPVDVEHVVVRAAGGRGRPRLRDRRVAPRAPSGN